MNPSQTAADGASGEQRYRFGEVVVDASAHTLVRAGEPQTVEPKAFAVLLVLLRRADELVGRDDLLDAVWGHRHVTPGVLTRAVAQLRHALGDDFHHPIYIQTQHALGYRFIGSLHTDDDAESPSEAVDREGPARERAGVGDVAPPTAVAPFGAEAAPAPQAVAAIAPNGVPDDSGASHVPPVGYGRGGDRPAAASWGRRWRWLMAMGVGLAFAVAILSWLNGRSRPGRPAEASIAVLPFTSLSNARDDRYFAEGLAVEMHDALAGVPGLEVVSARPAAKGDGNEVDVKTLGRRLGVATVLDASVRRDGPRVRISARLSDTGTGFTLWAGSYDRETADVFALQSEIANEVVQALLGMLPGDGRALAKRLAPTHSIVAYDAYLKGIQQLQELGEGKNLDNAIGFFREALAADPVFARAQAGICRAGIAQFESARDAGAFERAQAACARASGMDPGLREVSLALGEMYRARGDPAKAIEHYNKALDDIALRPAAYVGLAKTEGAQGRNALALDYFQRALKLRPGDAAIHRDLGYQHYLAGDLPTAIDAYLTATTLQPDDETLWNSLGGLYLTNGNADAATKAFERSLAIKPNYAALSNFGTFKYDAGAYAEAADLYRHAAELDPADYRIWGNIGDALSALPATAAQAHEPYRRAADMAERYVGIKSDDAQALGLLAWYRANLGEDNAARESLARAEALATERGEVAFLGAQALALIGDAKGARLRVAQARAADIPAQRIQASPVLRRLTRDGHAGSPETGPVR
ncbi:MAG: tetratricopeptide repeat protein [Lysobacter sp.]